LPDWPEVIQDLRVEMTPDGKHLVFENGLVVGLRGAADAGDRPATPAAKAGTLKKLADWTEGQTGRVLTLAFSPDGKRLVSGGDDGRMIVRLAPSGRVESSIHYNYFVLSR